MNGEIICIGTELLLGDTLNTNSRYLSQELSSMGINIFFHSIVGDNADRLKTIMSAALSRSDMIIVTGGLGPTQDDLTKETISELLDIPLEIHSPSLEHIKSYFSKSSRKMTSNNIKQSYIPVGSTVIPNDNGTAPGVIINKDEKIVVLLPGPPREMMPMFEKHVKPYINKIESRNFYSRYYRVVGIGESALEDRLLDIIKDQSNPTLATYAGDSEVLLRLTANASTQKKANDILQHYEELIKNKIGEYIYGGKEDTLEKVVANNLIKREQTLSIAESCTGGLLSSRLTSVPGISKVLHSGIVCYSNQAKEKIIGVSPKTLEKYGPVSSQVAEELCRKLYDKTKTDFVLSITGLAGPSGGTQEKPVGLVYIGLLHNNNFEIHKFNLTGTRKRIQKRTTQLALDILRKKLNSII